MNYSTVGNIPDIFKGMSIGNGYERKIMERSGRYKIAIGLFHPAMPGHVSLKCGEDVGQASNARQSFPVNWPGQAL